MVTTKHRVNASQKKMTCKCGTRSFTRFVGGTKKATSKNTAAAAKLSKMGQAKKVQAKKVQAKKTKGTPCKCTNPFKKGG